MNPFVARVQTRTVPTLVVGGLPIPDTTAVALRRVKPPAHPCRCGCGELGPWSEAELRALFGDR